VLDGVYAAAPSQDAPALHPLDALEDHEVYTLTLKIGDKRRPGLLLYSPHEKTP
jgi:hypothetical protein